MRNIITNKLIKLIMISAAVLTLMSCQTTVKEIPEDLSALQLIQRGQDSMAKGSYAQAEKYYVACIARFGSNLKTYIEARYELAQVNYKQKNYDMAKKMYQEILDAFDDPNVLYQVQPKYKKLAKMGLERIQAIEDKKASDAAAKEAKKAEREAKKNKN